MMVVYAKGAPSNMDFGLAQGGELMPDGAVVYAVCDGNKCVDYLDEHTFSNLTDLEYDKFKALITQAHRIESERLRFARRDSRHPWLTFCAEVISLFVTSRQQNVNLRTAGITKSNRKKNA
jgi:hypothetical protein